MISVIQNAGRILRHNPEKEKRDAEGVSLLQKGKQTKLIVVDRMVSQDDMMTVVRAVSDMSKAAVEYKMIPKATSSEIAMGEIISEMMNLEGALKPATDPLENFINQAVELFCQKMH